MMIAEDLQPPLRRILIPLGIGAIVLRRAVGGGEAETSPARQFLRRAMAVGGSLAVVIMGALLFGGTVAIATGGTAFADRDKDKKDPRDDDHGRQRREELRGDERDGRLIPQGREVVDAREAHDLPPRRLVAGLGVAGGLGLETLEEPLPEVHGAAYCIRQRKTAVASTGIRAVGVQSPMSKLFDTTRAPGRS